MAISSKGETATLKLPSNIEDGARGFILDLQLQVWSLEAQNQRFSTVNLNTTSRFFFSRSLWLKFFGSRYQKPGTKDTEVSSDISVDSTVGKGVV